MPPKISLFQFKVAMRKCGEYTNARLDGLYLRYLAGDIPADVATAIAGVKPVTAAEVEYTARFYKKPEGDAALARERKREADLTARHQKILLTLKTHGKPMTADQIAHGMGIVGEYAQHFLRQLVAEKLVVVTKVKSGHARKNMYSLAENSKEKSNALL